MTTWTSVHHEAGHIVGSLVLKLEVRSVEVYSPRRGLTRFANTWSVPARLIRCACAFARTAEAVGDDRMDVTSSDYAATVDHVGRILGVDVHGVVDLMSLPPWRRAMGTARIIVAGEPAFLGVLEQVLQERRSLPGSEVHGLWDRWRSGDDYSYIRGVS